MDDPCRMDVWVERHPGEDTATVVERIRRVVFRYDQRKGGCEHSDTTDDQYVFLTYEIDFEIGGRAAKAIRNEFGDRCWTHFLPIEHLEKP